MAPEIVVRNVTGRYPHRRASLQSDNITASVSEIARVYRIRLDDAEHPDAWIELVVEVDAEPIIVGKSMDEAA